MCTPSNVWFLKDDEPQSRFARLWLDSQHDNYPKGYAQSKCVSYIVTMRAGDG